MANPIYQNPQPKQMTQQQAYNEFCQNPTDYLVKCGLNIPRDFHGDYRALVEHLARTGQVPKMLQGRVNAMLNGR
jgi:hypothetical protein